MAAEWRERPIGELAEIFDGPHATPAKTDSGPVFLGISNLAQGRLNLTELERLSEHDYVRWTRRVEPQPGDVVFSYETRLGEAARIPLGLRCCLGRRMGLLRARQGEVDERFLLYAYLGPQFQETLRSRTIHGSTVDRIPLIDMPGFPISVPSELPEQRAIAHILGTLDDKIELNRRMSETLEAMARALFKSWFVDFDPVRAKAEGRDPGLPKPLADLFPARLVDSELGEIPEGWRVERLSDVMTFQGGAQPPASQFISEERQGYVRLVQIRDFYSNDHITFVPDSPKLRKFETDDIMIARYGSSGNAEKSNDSLARICRGLSGAYNVALVRVIPKRPCREFLGQFLQSASFQSVIKGMGARSVQSGFRKEDLDIIDVVVAPEAVHAAFERFASDVWERTKLTDRQSRTLAAVRDALLPKLIGGEIRVKDRTNTVENR